MKKYIRSNEDNLVTDYLNIEITMSDILKDKVQRRIYGKMMNLVDDAVEPWLQGVLDLAELSGIELSGITTIWNAIQEHGVVAVKESLNRQ